MNIFLKPWDQFVTYTLVEFSKSSSSHSRVISPVYLGYVVSFDVGNFVHG